MKNSEIYGLPYIEAGDLVEDIAGQSKAFVEGVESVMLTSDFRGSKGDQGEPGPPGLPGVNAVPADEAVAAYVNASDTASRAALEANFGDAATAALVGDESSATGAAVRALTGQGVASDDSIAGLVVDADSETGTAVRAALQEVTDPINAQVTQIMGQAATVEDLATAANIPWVSDGGVVKGEATWAMNHTPFTAPFRMRIIGLTIMHDREDIPASATSYVTFTMRRMRNKVTANIVARDTKTSGLLQRIPFDFAGQVWDQANTVLDPGDALNVAISPTAATIRFPLYLTIRYEPA